MTRENAKNLIQISNKEVYPYNIVDNVDEIIDKIYDHFEAQLKAKDDAIIKHHDMAQVYYGEATSLKMELEAKDKIIADLEFCNQNLRDFNEARKALLEEKDDQIVELNHTISGLNEMYIEAKEQIEAMKKL